MTITLQGLSQTTARLCALQSAAALLGRTSVVVGSPSPIAAMLDAGTRPHVIRPRNARALRFATSGGVRFARSVRHPGTRPLRFFARGGQQARPQVVAQVRQGMAAVVAGAPPQAAVRGLVQGGVVTRDAIRALAPSRSGGLRASIGVYVDGRLVEAA